MKNKFSWKSRKVCHSQREGITASIQVCETVLFSGHLCHLLLSQCSGKPAVLLWSLLWLL